MKIAPHFYDLCPEALRYGIAALFAQYVTIRLTRRIFMAKGTAIFGLRHGHHSAALLVRERDAIYAILSSAAAPHLLHSF